MILYEMEPCPFSRKVREALSILDLDAEIRPCPREGERHRSELRELRGETTVPYLIDPNTDRQLGDSDAIVAYLFRTYGDGRIPFSLRPGRFTDTSSKLASLFRAKLGGKARAAAKPELSLELWSFESCPNCRLVREWLSAHELPYLLHNAAFGSASREGLRARFGRVELPVLRDPNTGDERIGVQAILQQLDRYAIGPEGLHSPPQLRFVAGGQSA